jgi:Holliday junction resolvase-like predicted endonuclease
VNFFDSLFDREMAAGRSEHDARAEVFEAYMDGKPSDARKRKLKLTRVDRDALFWSSTVVASCTAEQWSGEPMTLALSRYLRQQKISAAELVGEVGRLAPNALIFAVRRSELVLSPDSPRRREIDEVSRSSEPVAELCRLLDAFDEAHRERVAELDRCKAELADVSAFELLALASLYAFENLVPHSLVGELGIDANGDRLDTHWDAINDLLVWRLQGSEPQALRIDDGVIGRSLKQYLSPLLFPDPAVPTDLPRRIDAFRRMMAAQIELNEFLARTVEAFCYDDSIRFERQGRQLAIVEIDPTAKVAWFRDGRKLERLHGYWFYRAFHSFVGSELAYLRIGRPENENDNRVAYIRAMRTHHRLREVYGVADTVSTEDDETVDLFQALLSLELMSAFFMRDFLAEFSTLASDHGSWVAALRTLALNGLVDGRQNRFPLTWSDRAAKVSNITGWTVTAAQQQGSARMAAAILDFWTYDMQAVAERIQRREPGLQPRLFERPVLKFGSTLVQLPWVVGLQNNSTAAINNLRRLGARRLEAREETRRIEQLLARLLIERGFRTLTNWMPPDDARDVGEVDIVASRDGHLFVFEVKSTFIRQSMRDAWVHATTTLRKAGRQLARKVVAVRASLGHDPALCEAVCLAGSPSSDNVHGWIVDTSIECDHQRFAGFLKVSLEEVLVALRDDSHWLDDPEGLVSGKFIEAVESGAEGAELRRTLFPDGFDAARFVEVVETEAVWAAP